MSSAAGPRRYASPTTSSWCRRTGDPTGATTSTPIRSASRTASIDGGVDLVHGHSSHHPRPIEVYSGKLILYGCGDLVDDYEGISGHERYRDELRLLYLPRLDPASGRLKELRLAPFQARQLRLHRASEPDAEWLRAVLDEVSRGFGSRIDRDAEGLLTLASRPEPADARCRPAR